MKFFVPVVLAVIIAFCMSIFIGCQSDTLTDASLSEEVILNVSTLFGFFDENLDEGTIISLILPDGDDEVMRDAENTGILEGGVKFGQFTNENAHPSTFGFGFGLNKAEPDPDCSVGVDGGGRRRFVNCVRDILDSCSKGATIIREGDTINAYSKC